MQRPGQWTRRQFSQALGAGAAASVLGGRAWAEEPRGLRGFAYVGSGAEGGTIRCFRVADSRWRLEQTIAAASPAHLEMHPTLPVLYAVHGVDLWEHLPRGAVSVYRIDPASGRLELWMTQRLSLAATLPRHAAVSPDGRSLLVAAEGGGIYNILPIAGDGGLEAPAMIRKEVGGAAPRHVMFHPDGGSVVAADAGGVGVFAVEADGLRLLERIAGHAPGGPSRIAYSAWSGCVYALNEADGSIAVHRPEGESLHPASQRYEARQPGLREMAMHPEGRFLVTAGVVAGRGLLAARAVDTGTGRMTTRGMLSLDEPPRALRFAGSGAHLLGVGVSGRIVQAGFDAVRGTFGRPQAVARVDGASSLLFRPA